MRRTAALVALVLLAGCGGDGGDDAPARKTAKADDGKAKACAAAKRTIADLPMPKDTDGDADYADQAADALEPAGSPAVESLRAIELAAVEVRIRAYNQAAHKLRRASENGRCGEREAARVLVNSAYSFALDDAILDHNRKSPKAPDDLPSALEFDARRYAVLERRIRELAVTDELQPLHDRFYETVKRSAELYRQWADDIGTYSNAASDRLDAVRDRAAKRLHRRLDKLLL